jgi:predicted membrane-bound mannosyltransferase
MTRRIFEAAVTGLPFCIFKFSAGWLIASAGNKFLGWLVMGWAAVDLAFNLAALMTERVSVCLLSNVGRWTGNRRGEDLFLALDTFLSFAIVAALIGFRLIRQMPDPWLSLWDLAVVLNVLGAGLARVLRVAGRKA